MSHQIFISYAGYDMDLIGNFQDRLKGYGVSAWVYSVDKTLSEETWKEIEAKIQLSSVMIFAVSAYTENAEGQKRELEIALNKFENFDISTRFFPLALRDTPFSIFPDKLRNINGERLDAHNVKTAAFKIASSFFPDLFENQRAKEWNIPVPGEWLEICGMHEIIEAYFEIGDILYFKTISPMGLFECFAPKINDLFWIAPEYVRPAIVTDAIKEAERNMPFIYTTLGQIQIERYGWDAWHSEQLQKA